MEGLVTPDGQAVDVESVKADADRTFAAAMAAPAGTDEIPAPPKRTDDPDKAKSRRGRPPKDVRARTRDAQPGEARKDSKAAQPLKDDYTSDAQALVGGIWTVAASVPLTQPYAAVLAGSSDALAAALAAGAKQSETIRRLVSGGSGTWQLQLAAVGMSMGMQCLQIARDPELREKARESTRQQLREALAAQGIEVP